MSSDAALPSSWGVQCLQPDVYLPKLTAAPFALLFPLFTIFLSPSCHTVSDGVTDLALEPEE